MRLKSVARDGILGWEQDGSREQTSKVISIRERKHQWLELTEPPCTDLYARWCGRTWVSYLLLSDLFPKSQKRMLRFLYFDLLQPTFYGDRSFGEIHNIPYIACAYPRLHACMVIVIWKWLSLHICLLYPFLYLLSKRGQQQFRRCPLLSFLRECFAVSFSKLIIIIIKSL